MAGYGVLAFGTRQVRTHGGGSYPLTALPMSSESSKERSTLSTVVTMQPFILDEKTYVSLTDGRVEWMVIAKHLRGERFEG